MRLYGTLRLNGSWLRLIIRSHLRLRPDLRLNWPSLARRRRLDLFRSLLRLNGPALGLVRPYLRTIQLIRLIWPYLRLVGPHRFTTWLIGSDRMNLRLIRLHLRLIRTHLRLIGSYLGMVGLIPLARANLRLIWSDLRLVRQVRARNRALNPLVGPKRCADGGERWTALVLIEKLLPVLGCLVLVLHLCRHGRNFGCAHGDQLCGSWPRLDTTSPSVIGDAPVVVIVDDDRAVVDVGDPVYVDPVHRAVVVEVVAAPVATVITVAGIAAAIGYASVETDIETPVAAIEAIAMAIECPIAGGPQRAWIGSGDPCTWNPVIADGSIAPIARGPDVVWRRRFGLFVGWQWRRRLIGLFNRLLTGIYLIVIVLVVVILIVLIVWSVGIRRGLLWSLPAVLPVFLCLLLAFVLLPRRHGSRRRPDRGCHGGGPLLRLVRLVYRLGLVDGSHICIRGVRTGVARRLARSRLPVAPGDC